jgi:predicted RND superfamily exporter protein
MIMVSFPITLVIYKLVMRVTNVSSLHLMVVFVVLGISADNIFVLWDAWRQSDVYPQYTGNYNKRMAYTFRRAYKSLLATSSTTAFAFMSNGFSSLMPVSAFGWFAFVIIPVNYVLIVMYYPAYLIIYERKVRRHEKNIIKVFKEILTFKSCRSFDWQGLFLQIFLDRFEQDVSIESVDQKSRVQIDLEDLDVGPNLAKPRSILSKRNYKNDNESELSSE